MGCATIIIGGRWGKGEQDAGEPRLSYGQDIRSLTRYLCKPGACCAGFAESMRICTQVASLLWTGLARVLLAVYGQDLGSPARFSCETDEFSLLRESLKRGGRLFC